MRISFSHKRFFKLLGIVLLLLISSIFLYLFYKYSITPKLLIDVVREDYSQLKQHNDRINIALLGIGGANHEGGDLTDTVQVISINSKTQDHVLIALPRDIWIPSLNDRINAAYKFGEDKATGSGLLMSKSVVEEVTGLPIHYAVLLDFRAFIQVVDAIGGIDVEIEESFVDEEYPIAGREKDLCNGDLEYRCRYTTVEFVKGQEHMDGARALIYVRSRHAAGNTGSDFSRGRRQQAVLNGLRNKMLTFGVITDRHTLANLQTIGRSAIKTDISISEQLLLGNLLLNSNRTFQPISLPEDLPQENKKGLLINPPLWQYGGAWVLVPKNDSFSQIHQYIQCVIQKEVFCEGFFD